MSPLKNATKEKGFQKFYEKQNHKKPNKKMSLPPKKKKWKKLKLVKFQDKKWKEQESNSSKLLSLEVKSLSVKLSY